MGNNMDNMSNVLITGGSGLLGSAITFGNKPSSEEVNLLKDGSLQSYLDKNPNIDTIIHAAGLVGGVKKNNDFIYDFFSKNLRMAINVMDVIARNKQIKNSIFILSTCIFPEDVKYPVDIDDMCKGEPHPTNYGYAYAKRMLEVGARALREQHNKNIKCLIPCNLYGENDNYNTQGGHVIPSLIHKCHLAKINNSDFVVWGSGNAMREFMYVNDLAKIIEIMQTDEKVLPDTMIISPDTEHSIREIVEIIKDEIQYNGKIIYDSTMPEGILRKPSNNKSFKTNFKDFQFTPLDQGLRKTIKYFIEKYPNIRS
jgi:GDP-L-fucose synthase